MLLPPPPPSWPKLFLPFSLPRSLCRCCSGRWKTDKHSWFIRERQRRKEGREKDHWRSRTGPEPVSSSGRSFVRTLFDLSCYYSFPSLFLMHPFSADLSPTVHELFLLEFLCTRSLSIVTFHPPPFFLLCALLTAWISMPAFTLIHDVCSLPLLFTIYCSLRVSNFIFYLRASIE